MSTANEKVPKYVSEEKALTEIRKLLDAGANKRWVAQGLAGLDSERAWQMRKWILDARPSAENQIAWSLVNLDSEKAWQMRNELLAAQAGQDSFVWPQKSIKGFVARGLAGLDSDAAWQVRNELIDANVDKVDVAISLVSLDCNKAWQMRKELLRIEGADRGVAISLSGLDSDKAWQMRKGLLSAGTDKDCIAQGLAGLDSDRAWQMRKDLFDVGADKGMIAMGIEGNYYGFVWRLITNKRCEETIVTSDEDANKEIKVRWQNLYKEFNDGGFDKCGLTEESAIYFSVLDRAIRELNEEFGIPRSRIIGLVSQYISDSEQKSERFFRNLADFLKD